MTFKAIQNKRRSYSPLLFFFWGKTIRNGWLFWTVISWRQKNKSNKSILRLPLFQILSVQRKKRILWNSNICDGNMRRLCSMISITKDSTELTKIPNRFCKWIFSVGTFFFSIVICWLINVKTLMMLVKQFENLKRLNRFVRSKHFQIILENQYDSSLLIFSIVDRLINWIWFV